MINSIFLGAVHNYQHFHKCAKGPLFLTPPPPSPKCTTRKVDIIINKIYSQKMFTLPFQLLIL